MKIYVKSEDYLQDYYPDLDFDEWIDDIDAEDQGYKYTEKLLSKIRRKYPNCSIDEESHVPGFEGPDTYHILIDGNNYLVYLDGMEEMWYLYTHGIDSAVDKYFNEIVKQINHYREV